MWRKPVGLGANRVRTVIASSTLQIKGRRVYQTSRELPPGLKRTLDWFVYPVAECNNAALIGRLAQR